MSKHSAQIAFLLSACLALTGCGSGIPDPTDSLREFVAAAFDRAAIPCSNRARPKSPLAPSIG